MPLQGVKVLAVDDNEVHSYALAKTLERFHAKITCAHSGEETLRMATLLPDVILLDVNLPDLNGFQICRRLKADPLTAEIPVIFITATYQSTSARDQAESAGGACILFHPVESNHLAAVIQGQLRKREHSAGS